MRSIYAWRGRLIMHENLLPGNLAAKEGKKKGKEETNQCEMRRSQAQGYSEREDRYACRRFSIDLLAGRPQKSAHYAVRSRSTTEASSSLSYESLNELRYVSRLTQGCDYVRGGASLARVRRIFLSLAPSMAPSHCATDFPTPPAIARDLRGIFSLADQPRNKLRVPGRDLDAPSKRVLLPPSCRSSIRYTWKS